MRASFINCSLCVFVWAMIGTPLVAQQAETTALPEPYIVVSGTVRGLELLPGEGEGDDGIDLRKK